MGSLLRSELRPRAPRRVLRELDRRDRLLNLIANVGDQFRRIELFGAYEAQLPARGATLVDVGCGTAALTLPFAQRFEQVVLSDFANTARDFVTYKRINARSRIARTSRRKRSRKFQMHLPMSCCASTCSNI